MPTSYSKNATDGYLIRDRAGEVSDADLLASMLRIDLHVAEAALKRFGTHYRPQGSLRLLLKASHADLSAVPGFGSARVAQLRAANEMIKRAGRESLDREDALTSPNATRRFLSRELRDEPHEVFCALFLDTRHHPAGFERLFRGTIDAAHVHPRVVVERALANRSAAVIVAHNHPSGVAEPSQADLAITRRLRDALALVDIRLLDHFIVGDQVVSLAERGLV